jgi:signal transduction histidine kinase
MSLDILDYSRTREPHCERVQLDRFLPAQAELMQLRAQEAEIALVCQGPPCQASLDQHSFHRVLENLLGNALDALAGQDGGRVTLQWAPAAEGGVEIQVIDNGKGIPRKVQKRIFEPFFSYGKAKGTGLGMATVKRIVEAHRGTVTVASEEGQGTTITLRLPGAADRGTGEIPAAGSAS